MSQNTENPVKKCEVVVSAASDVEVEQNNSSNTLKSVRKKFRNFTIGRKSEEKVKSDSNGGLKEMGQEQVGDETIGKSKLTLKKLFRKSSFKKFISNIQHFTIKTVSGLRLLHSFISESRKNREPSIVRRKKRLLDSLE